MSFGAVVERAISLGEIGLSHIQYLGLVSSVNVDWPAVWRYPMSWLKIFSLDLNIPEIHMPDLDYRIYFLIVCVAVPLVLTFIILLFFNPLMTLLWYFAIVLSLAAIVAGAFGMSMQHRVSLPFESYISSRWLLVFGGIVLGVCLLVLLYKAIMNRVMIKEYAEVYRRKINRKRKNRVTPVESIRMEEIEEADKKRKKEMKADVDVEELDGEAVKAWEQAATMKKVEEPQKSLSFYLWILGAIAVLIFLALVSLRIVDFQKLLSKTSDPYTSYLKKSPIFKLGAIAGIVLFCIAGILLVYTLFCLPQWGRNFVRHLKILLNEQFIRVTLLVLMVVYIPITNVLLTSWSCSKVSCNPGAMLPYKASILTAKSIVLGTDGKSTSSSCITCSFENDTCLWDTGNSSAGCSCMAELCPGATSRRLIKDAGIPCSEVSYYFAPVSAVMGLALVAGIPFLYYRIVKYHTHFLQQLKVDGQDVEERWKARIHLSRNSAKSLYLDFEHKWRYYKTALLAQKLVVVIVTIFLQLLPKYSSICLAILYLSTFLLGLLSQPYISRVLDFVAMASSLTLMFSSAIAVAAAFGASLPDALVLVVAILDYAVPVFAGVVGFIVQCVQDKKITAKLKKLEEKKNSIGSSTSSLSSQDLAISPRTIFAMDWQLNNYTMKIISSFFLFLGAMSFIALSIGIMGILVSNAESPVISTDDYASSKGEALEKEFAKYLSWEDFATNCCCHHIENQTKYPLTETWICHNNYIKERLRAVKLDNGTVTSGLDLRPYCSRTFTPGVVCGFDFQDSNIVVVLCDGVGAPYNESSSDVLSYLW